MNIFAYIEYMHKKRTDIDSAGKYGNRDAETFRQVFLQYGQMVFRFSARILGNTSDAEDMVQTVFIRAWEAFGRYDSRYSMATWLRTITCRMCYDELRKRSGRYEYGIDAAVERCGSGTPEDLRIREESLRELNLAIGGLPPKQRIIFIMREMEELSTEETAKATGLSAMQVKSNLYFARQAIKKRMEEIFD